MITKIFKFFIVFLMLISSSLFAKEQSYICIDIDNGGFYYNGSGYQLTLFELDKFIIKIDFDNKFIRSDHPNLFLAEPICLDSMNLAYLTCASRYGETFMINRMNLEFTYSSIFGHVGDGPNSEGYADPIGIRFGVCRQEN